MLFRIFSQLLDLHTRFASILYVLQICLALVIALQATFLYQKAAFLLMAKRAEREASSSKRSSSSEANASKDAPFIDATDDEIKEMMK